MIIVKAVKRELHIMNTKENAGEDLVVLPLEDAMGVVESIKQVAMTEEFKKQCALGLTLDEATAQILGRRGAFEKWLESIPNCHTVGEKEIEFMWKVWAAGANS